MAGSVSPATGCAYGVARVCRVWDVPRSSFYAAQRAAQAPASARPTGRRGPKPAVPDTALLAAIRADLARSPWSGEAIARSGRGCASGTGCASRASGCCG